MPLTAKKPSTTSCSGDVDEEKEGECLRRIYTWFRGKIGPQRWGKFAVFRLSHCVLFSFADPGQWDVKREILKILLCLVPDKTRQSLMLLSEARKLWDAPAKLELNVENLQRDFCRAVLEFQTGMSANRPRITFGNLTTLRLSLFSRKSLVKKFAKILVFLPIQDLGIQDCTAIPDFMEKVVKVWAPALQNLLILRVFYDASAVLEEDQDVSHHLLDIPSSARTTVAARGPQ